MMNITKTRVIIIIAAFNFLLHPCLAEGTSYMAHDIEGLPPYADDGEDFADDPVFAAECAAKARDIADKNHLKLHKPLLTRNSKFGLVWRADFDVPDGVEEYVNRVMFWKWPDGRLATFFGSNLDVPPLERQRDK